VSHSNIQYDQIHHVLKKMVGPRASQIIQQESHLPLGDFILPCHCGMVNNANKVTLKQPKTSLFLPNN